MKLTLLFLTCANDNEANVIAKSLLEQKLVFCVKKIPTSSSFLWKGMIEVSNEVLLIMDSLEANFTKINEEIKKLHSYETFVLVATPVSDTTKEVLGWIEKENVTNSHQ